MNQTPTQIGFDRFIDISWLRAAIAVRLGQRPKEDLQELLSDAQLGQEARAKTLTKLNALVLHPKAGFANFIERGIAIFIEHPNLPISAFAWGASIVTYPYFGKVAEITGRLAGIQGDCSALEIHRRVSETYGDREITKRATQAVLQTQSNWGALSRADKGKRIALNSATPIDNDPLTAWLIEGAACYAGKALSIATLPSLPVLYPFALTRPLAYIVSNSAHLEMRTDGPSNQHVVPRVRTSPRA